MHIGLNVHADETCLTSGQKDKVLSAKHCSCSLPFPTRAPPSLPPDAEGALRLLAPPVAVAGVGTPPTEAWPLLMSARRSRDSSLKPWAPPLHVWNDTSS